MHKHSLTPTNSLSLSLSHNHKQAHSPNPFQSAGSHLCKLVGMCCANIINPWPWHWFSEHVPAQKQARSGGAQACSDTDTDRVLFYDFLRPIGGLTLLWHLIKRRPSRGGFGGDTLSGRRRCCLRAAAHFYTQRLRTISPRTTILVHVPCDGSTADQRDFTAGDIFTGCPSYHMCLSMHERSILLIPHI